MPILSKGNTFADGDQVTSTKLNNLVDSATFVSGSSGTTDNATLEVNGSGRLQVKTIQTGNIANSAVTTAKIANSSGASDGITTAKIATGAVTTEKIADSTGSSDGVTTAKIADDAVTQAKIADAAVGTAQLIDANITAAKLNGAQSGNAPIYGIRAWAKLNPYVGSDRTTAYKTGTYSRTALETTVDISAHGLKVNDAIRLDFTSGSGTAGLYIVTNVPSANQFVVNHSGSVTSGNVTAQFIVIQASGNISSASWYNAGDNRMVLNFSSPMPSVDYAVVASGHHYPNSWLSTMGEDTLGTTQLNTVNQAHVYQGVGSRFCSILVVG